MVTDAKSAQEIAEMLAKKGAPADEAATTAKKRGGRPKKATEDK